MTWLENAIDFGKNILSGNVANSVAGIFGKQTQQQQAQNEITAAQKLNDFNANEAQKTRDYNTQMSNTAYQRATADMKKAGINPIVAYQQGGASTPSGAQASGAKANQNTSGSTSGGIMKSVQNIASSALQVAKLLAL